MEQSAKAFFQKLLNADRQIDTLLEELEMYQTRAKKMTASLSREGHGGGGVSRSMENSVEQIVKTRAKLAAQVAELTEMTDCAYKIFERMPDEKERDCLKNRYILCKTWEQVADTLGMTYQGVCNLHGRALQTADEQIKILFS